jgi:putative flippase GtrA
MPKLLSALPIFFQQLMGFLAAGAMSTAVQYLVLWGCVEANWLAAPLASGLGYALGAAIHYCLSYFFIFNSNRAHTQSIRRFVIMVAIGWTLTVSLMLLFNKKLDWYYWPAQLLTTLLVLFWNFLVSRWWVFKSL